MSSPLVAGEYYLQGMQEMASGFLLKTDNSFQFFFIYGALDRHGAGTWRQENDRVILNSGAHPANGYSLVSSAKKDHEPVMVKLEGNNSMVLRHTYVSLENGVEGSWKEMNEIGEARFPGMQPSAVSLLLELCPEKIATIPVNKDHNEFVFRIEPSILEVFFDNFFLSIEKNALSGDHPVMHGGTFRYERQ